MGREERGMTANGHELSFRGTNMFSNLTAVTVHIFRTVICIHGTWIISQKAVLKKKWSRILRVI